MAPKSITLDDTTHTIDSTEYRDGDLLDLTLAKSGTLVINGVNITLNSIIGASVASSTTIKLINGATLTTGTSLAKIGIAENFTYEIGEKSPLHIIGSSIDLDIADTTTIDFEPSGGTGTLIYTPPTFALKLGPSPTLLNLHKGDKIEVTGATSYYVSDGMVHFQKPNFLGINGDIAVFHVDAAAQFSSISADGTVTVEIPCFLEGTLISTPGGEIRVEYLKKGDLIYTLNGETRAVTWVGNRTIFPKKATNPRECLPIRIRPGSLEEDMPHRDLYLSPDHCLFLDGYLIPAKLLINGTTITQDVRLEPFTYYHIELEQHSVLVADGAYAESYLDLGNRGMFLAPGTLMFSAPIDLSKIVHCYPPLYSGPILEEFRHTLAQRAEELGYHKHQDRDSLGTPSNVFPFSHALQ
ncbi:Hint domain-containing protein (plasmid) [Phyllobacterium sp. 628]|uniref:Hint domain-containing protein n=1 Tax=Phyllobacterium sp. 628 TaxID=2718938 RepID=UPI0016627FDD|nr:Hint domain-containing protein [Phyllobacterium sp. 628]QND54828.1 Hint domain-containing protein [Phyllobacterium sp. 628]